MVDITWLVELVVWVVFLIIARYLIPWLNAKVKAEKNSELDFWIEVGVMAMEEAYKNVSGSGKKKFEEVVLFLESKGYTVDETVQTMIDAKVRELFNWGDYSNEIDYGEIAVGGTD